MKARSTPPGSAPGAATVDLPEVDEDAERALVAAGIADAVKSKLPTQYTPRDKPLPFERAISARHDAHQHVLVERAAERRRKLDGDVERSAAVVATIERDLGALDDRQERNDAELREVDDRLAADDPQRRYERIVPVATHLGLAAALFLELPWTVTAIAYVTDYEVASSEARVLAAAVVVIQVWVLHALGRALKELAATTMNADKRRITRALVAGACVGGAVFGVGMVAVRAAQGSGTWHDTVLFAGLQVAVAVLAVGGGYTGHSPLAEERRRLRAEVEATDRERAALRARLTRSKEEADSYRAARDAFPEALEARRHSTRDAYQHLVLEARQKAEAAFTAADHNTDRAELLEHFPVLQLVVPDDLGVLDDDSLLDGPHQLALF